MFDLQKLKQAHAGPNEEEFLAPQKVGEGLFEIPSTMGIATVKFFRQRAQMGLNYVQSSQFCTHRPCNML